MLKRNTIENPRFIKLPRIEDLRGNLSFLENNNQIPFEIQRVCWFYNTPREKPDIGYSLRNTDEVIFVLSGSFNVNITNGINTTTYILNQPNFGVLVPKMNWRSLEKFSTNSIGLIIHSENNIKGEMINNRNEYNSLIHGK